MIRPDLGEVYLAVPSSGRPQNVPQTEAIIGKATWIVPIGQEEAYRALGATVIGIGERFPASRNVALERAFRLHAPCLQVDDDIKNVERILGKNKKVEITFAEAVKELLFALKNSPFKLGGAAPTRNSFFFDPEKPIKTRALIVSSFIIALPNPLRFDPSLPLKDSYDHTCQHVHIYGGVIRDDSLSLDFSHYTNAGGCQDYRTPELEKLAIERLRSKWGRWISDHPTRENEVLLRLKRAPKVF